MNSLHRRSARVERLESRRLLSASVEATTDPLVNDALAGTDWSEGSERLAKLLSMSRSPEPFFDPTSLENAALPAGIVGGTASTARRPTGALTGKIVYTVGGHGFTSDNANRWHTQRPNLLGMIEDLGNQDQMTFYVDYLFNAGATVVPLRPVGNQPIEVLLDNDDPGVTYAGAWSNSTSTLFYGSAGDVPYRFASGAATQTATATFTPNIPADGFYPVYTWARHGSDRLNQLYRVTHSGGVTEVRIDHSRVGNGYVYLGTYHFNTGSAGNVQISNLRDDGSSGGVVIADHIRFGNGMGDIARTGGPSGRTRSDEAALYWIEHQRGQGIPTSEYRSSSDDDTANVGAPPRWAEQMNREAAGPATDRLFLSFHSNAGGGSGRGTLGLYNGNNVPSTKTPYQFEWAKLVGQEVNDDLVAQNGLFEHNWHNRGTSVTLDRSDIEFGEINNSYVQDEFDATIVEVGYHDNTLDAALMRDGKVRDAVARASLQATIKYFNQFAGAPLAMPPDTPGNVRATTASNGDVTVSWTAPTANSYLGDAATGYVVYRSANGYGFGNAVTASGGLSVTIPAQQVGNATYFRVAATNAGGESVPSEVLAARGAPGSKVLIVNGFDRLDRTSNPLQHGPTNYATPYVPSSETWERVQPRFSNSFDYAARTGEAIKAYTGANVPFDTASNEAVVAGQVSLSNYAAVIWLSGEESTVDDTFNATEQALVSTYLNAGGKLFVSGSEIGWDLDAQGNGAAFYNNQLKADYVSDDANTYAASGAAGSIFAGIALSFDNGTQGTYDVDYADRIAAFGGSTVSMIYTGGLGGGAAIQYANPNGGRVVTMGFPFETITTAANRDAVMARVLDFFALTGGSIAGRVYEDRNGNGLFDGTDVATGGVSVILDLDNDGLHDPGEAITTTDAAGNYAFTNVAPGTYRARIPFNPAVNEPYVHTRPTVGNWYELTVTAGAEIAGRDFARFPTRFTGTAGNDTYYLRLDPTGDRVEISLASSPLAPPTYTILRNKLPGLSFFGGNGDDTLVIDLIHGDPVPGTSGVNYLGGNGNDALVLLGTADEADIIGFNSASISATVTTILHNGIEAHRFDGRGGGDQIIVNSGVVELLAAQKLSALTLNGGGILDVRDHALVIDYTDPSPTGTWTGSAYDGLTGAISTGRLVSSLASGTLKQLGIAEAAGALGLSAAQTGTWRGMTVDSTSVLVKLTWGGDANLDGRVNIDDYGRIDSSVAQSGSVWGWFNGDFNYDGAINIDDYGIIDGNVSTQDEVL